MSQTSTSSGIHCPECGSGSSVHRTLNYVTWIKRTRVCRNKRCRHVWETKETTIKPAPDRPDGLFK